MHAAMEGVVDCVGAVSGHYHDATMGFQGPIQLVSGSL